MLHLLTILLFTVVIDAGHGGKDPGAIGKRLQEKNINLEVSQMLARQIQTNYPDVNVLLTRNDDRFLTLQERANFVNNHKADLFICVHTNSSEGRSSHGAETYVLGTEKMDKNLDVAMRENSVITLESDYKTGYQGFDPNSVESYIMFSLMQNEYMDNSLQFASLVQRQFSDRLHRADRGVRQAAFWVLLKSACPSVLVEVGFISNPDEEAYLGTRSGKEQLAGAIYNAFTAYYRSKTGAEQKEIELNQNDTTKVETPAQTQAKAETKTETTADTVVTKPTSPVLRLVEQQIEVKTQLQHRYAVQIAASKKVLPTNDKTFHGIDGVMMIQKGDVYKYYVCPTEDLQKARDYRDQLQKKFPDCFIISLE